MLASESGKNNLEKYSPAKSNNVPPGQSDALEEAMDLLYRILNASFTTSGTPLRGEWNGHQENIQGIYWKCKEQLDKACKDPEKTGFLAMSVLEHAWSMARQLVLCPISIMLDGDMSMLDDAKKLEAVLRDNIYKTMWEEKVGAYAELLNQIGFDADPELFRDLTQIMDPLLDAMTFYQANPNRIYRIRSGEISSEKQPVVAKAMCKYRSEKELVDAVMASGHECLLAFGAVEKTNAQIKDRFYEWFTGHAEERQTNTIRNEKITADEYLAAPAAFTRAVYLCVRSNKACWLVHLPWKGDMYHQIGCQANEYYYGKRASYAPYQIFYDQTAPAPAGSSMLSVPKTAWLLSDLMDPLSMAWYPAFLDETIRMFFRDATPESVDQVLPEETAIRIPNQKSDRAVVPVRSSVPAVCSHVYQVQPVKELFPDEPFMAGLAAYFRIAPKDLKDIPILPVKPGTAEQIDQAARERSRKAYIKLIAVRIAGLNRTRWDARKFLVDKILARKDQIIAMALDGRLSDQIMVTVDGTPELNPDGTVKMGSKTRYPHDPIPITIKTDPDDARESSKGPYENFVHQVFWASEPTASRPPVVIAIRPKTAEHCAALTGTDIGQLPDLVRLIQPLQEFYAAFKDILPNDLSNSWIALKKSHTSGVTCFVPCLAPVNICMTKKAYKNTKLYKIQETKQ